MSLNEIGTAVIVKQMGWVLHSHTECISHKWFAYLLLWNVCFLVLVSEGLGGEVSRFAIGWDSLSVLNLLFCDWLSIRERRSVVVLSGVRLFWLARSRTVRVKLELRYTWFPAHRSQTLQVNMCELYHHIFWRELLHGGRYIQCFVFVLRQDLVVGF